MPARLTVYPPDQPSRQFRLDPDRGYLLGRAADCDLRIEDPRLSRHHARLTLAELSELLHVDFEREDISTVGGLVYEQFGRAPRQGESFQLGGYRVTVDRVERRRVQRVSFERVDARPGHAA